MMSLENAFIEQLAQYIEINYKEYLPVTDENILYEKYAPFVDIPERKELTRDQSMDLQHLLDEAGDSFHEKLFELIDKSGMSDVEVYKRACIDRRLFSKIRSNPAYHPGKSTVLALVFALKLDIKAARDLLARAEYALSPSNKGDLIIKYFIEHTLFAALFQEALKMEKQKEFLNAVSEGRIVLSDAFPYIGKNYYIPKPMISVRVDDDEKQGNSRQKKMFKNLKYIPVNTVEAFINGTFPEEHMEDMQYLGTNGMKVSVGIRGMEEPQPYRVSTYHFTDGSGLYIIAGMESEKDQECLDELFESLQYTGLGGKKSSGMGRFKCRVCDIPREIKEQLTKKASMHLLLSTALPEDEELEDILKGATYSLLKRSGFIDSQTYAAQQMRKSDIYVFSAGSCFVNTFKGKVIEERNGGTHPIFRYAKAFFMGV